MRRTGSAFIVRSLYKTTRLELYCSLLTKNDAFGINTLRENGFLKTDTLDKANFCNRQFQPALTRESDVKIPSKGTSPFTPMGEITVDPNGVLKLLNNLKIHKAPGPDGLSARVLKECSSEIAPILALIYNETLAQGTVPDHRDDWRQTNVKGRNMMQQIIDRCRSHASVAKPWSI